MSSISYREAAEADLASGRDLHLLRRLLAYAMAHPRLFVLGALLFPVDALTAVLPPFLVRQILDVALPSADHQALGLYSAAYLGALVLEFGVGVASLYAMSVLGQRAMRDLRRDLFAHVQRLPAAFFDKHPTGRTLTRLTTDVEAVADVFATGAVTVIGDVLVIVAVVSTMLWLDVRLTLVSFMVVPPLVLLSVFFQRLARRAFREIRRHIARINAYLGEHVAGMSIVQAFRQERRTAAEFLRLNEEFRVANRAAILYDAVLYSVVEAIGTCAVAALLWWGSGELTSGVVGAGTFVAFVQYIRRFFIPIRDLSTKYTVLQHAFAGAERVFQLLDEPVVIRSKPGAALAPERLKQGLEVSDVWFSYRPEPTQADWVLRGVNLAVGVGERVAIVGATGSGKTTLVKLMNRTYDPQRGVITMDGTDLRDLDLTTMRRKFAVVLQDVHLFAGTVRENLAFGGSQDQAALETAARAVQAHELIARLPGGYDARIEECGNNLSGGERQLLAFARALAVSPEVLVLDEATSSVDSETEAKLVAAVDVLMRNRTAVIVAHRLSTVRKVDRIIVMQNGAVVDQGSHDALMARGGLYRRLVELQLDEGERR